MSAKCIQRIGIEQISITHRRVGRDLVGDHCSSLGREGGEGSSVRTPLGGLDLEENGLEVAVEADIGADVSELRVHALAGEDGVRDDVGSLLRQGGDLVDVGGDHHGVDAASDGLVKGRGELSVGDAGLWMMGSRMAHGREMGSVQGPRAGGFQRRRRVLTKGEATGVVAAISIRKFLRVAKADSLRIGVEGNRRDQVRPLAPRKQAIAPRKATKVSVCVFTLRSDAAK
jgi:hypothetical protein